MATGAQDPIHDNARAIAAMLAAMALLIANDVLVKLASSTLGTGQIVLLRGLVASILLFALAMWRGELAQWRALSDIMVLVRIAAEVMATILFLAALFRMPIGQVTAIMQFSPLVATAGSALFLKEPVGWRRWLAALAGFGGVMMVVKPGIGALEAASVFALASVLFVAMRDLATRRIRHGTPSLLVTLATSSAVAALGGAITLGETWQAVSTTDALLVGGAGLLIMCSYYLMVVAMRTGEVSVISAYRYSIIIWAILAGYLVWGEVPDPWTFAGVGVLVATGIYTFRREARLRRPRPGQAI